MILVQSSQAKGMRCPYSGILGMSNYQENKENIIIKEYCEYARHKLKPWLNLVFVNFIIQVEYRIDTTNAAIT